MVAKATAELVKIVIFFFFLEDENSGGDAGLQVDRADTTNL